MAAPRWKRVMPGAVMAEAKTLSHAADGEALPNIHCTPWLGGAPTGLGESVLSVSLKPADMALDMSRLLIALSVINVLFSFASFVSAAYVSGKCFTTPCYEGEGYQDVWSVGYGNTFLGVCASFAIMAQSVYIILSLTK